MPITLNGTNGIITPLDVEIQGSTSGSITIAVPAVAGSNTQTLVATTGTLAPIVSGTAVASTSGTSIDFTGIPNWVRRITLMFNGVSSNSTNLFLIQLGTSGSIETSSYNGTAGWFGATNLAFSTAMSSGFLLTAAGGPTFTGSGVATVSLLDSSTNTWAMQSTIARYDSGNNFMHTSAGSKALASTLTRVRITTVGGTDTFDTGSINILYE
jgi:hypothetical protein